MVDLHPFVAVEIMCREPFLSCTANGTASAVREQELQI
jgi:hypothetical protein